jgi:hypothetical protein
MAESSTVNPKQARAKILPTAKKAHHYLQILDTASSVSISSNLKASRMTIDNTRPGPEIWNLAVMTVFH